MTDAVGENERLRRSGLHELASEDPASLAAEVAARLRTEVVVEIDLDRAVAVLDGLTDDGTPARLRSLAAELARAERILARTEARAVRVLADRISASAGLILHPHALRDASDAVLAARGDLARAESDLEQHDQLMGEQLRVIDVAEVTPHAPGGRRQARRRVESVRERRSAMWRAFGFGLVGLAVGVAVVVFGPVPWPAALTLPILAALWGIRRVRAIARDHADRAEARESLAMVDAMAGLAYQRSGALPWTASPVIGDARRRRLGGVVEMARERVRVAESRWHELAGTDEDPADIEGVLASRDPQRLEALRWVDQAPAVRAVTAHHGRVRTEWRLVWSALDLDPPGSADAEVAIGLVAVKGRAVAEAGRPVVVLDPPLGGHAGLARIATRVPVVVVRGPQNAPPPGADGDRAGDRIDGADGSDAGNGDRTAVPS